jgi:hypothetical protein
VGSSGGSSRAPSEGGGRGGRGRGRKRRRRRRRRRELPPHMALRRGGRSVRRRGCAAGARAAACGEAPAGALEKLRRPRPGLETATAASPHVAGFPRMHLPRPSAPRPRPASPRRPALRARGPVGLHRPPRGVVENISRAEESRPAGRDDSQSLSACTLGRGPLCPRAPRAERRRARAGRWLPRGGGDAERKPSMGYCRGTLVNGLPGVCYLTLGFILRGSNSHMAISFSAPQTRNS